MSVNNDFTYSDVLKKIPGTKDSLRLDIDNFLSKIGNGSSINFNTNISIAQIGFRIRDFGAVTIFANERAYGGLVYPKSLIEYLWNGNGEYVGQTFTSEDIKTGFNYFREYGVGYSHQLTVLGTRKLTLGARIKVLQGFVNIKTADNFSVDILTDSDTYNLNIAVNDPAFYTAGIDILEDDDSDGYFGSNANKGMGFDLGAELELNEKINLSVAINDIGSITWKEGVRNYTVNNTTIDFGGIDLKDDDDLSSTLEDTLRNKFDDEKNAFEYSSKLNTRTFIGGTYKLSKHGTASATISNTFAVGKTNTSFGLGYTHQFGKIFTLSGTISKKPQHRPAIGAGFATRFGFFQLYGSMDNILGIADATQLQTVDFRIGMNFLFGRTANVKAKKAKKEKTKPSEKKSTPPAKSDE